MQTPVYRFGRFFLDPRARELREEGAIVPMPPKSFDCVAYLIEHRARAVGRDELISAVWGSTDVSDHTLGQTLLRARQALGDVGASERTMVRTVPRFGYRWIAPVEILAAPESAVVSPTSDTIAGGADTEVGIAPADASPLPHMTPAPPRPSRRGLVAALAVLALVIAAGGLATRLSSPAETDVPVAVHAADARLFMVLPVQLANDDTATTWVRLGVMDFIGTLLRDEAGQAVLPSDQVVTLIGRDGGPMQGDAGHGLGRLRVASGATHLVLPRAELVEGRWFVELDLYRDDTLDTFTGNADAPLDAAAQAVGQMLSQLRLHRIWEDREPAEDKELLARIDAALLMGELQHADKLIATASATTRAAPQFQVRAGNVALRQGRLAEAEALYRPVADAAAIDNAPLRAAAAMGLGAVAILRADNAAADAAYGDAIALLASGREAGLLGRSYMGRGAARVLLERFDEASSDFSRARVDMERAGDRIGLATLDTNVAMAAHNRGRYAEALAAQDRAIVVLAGFGVRDQLVVSLHNKVYTQLALLDVAGALATAQQAMEQVTHLANPAFNRRVGAAMTRTLLATGRLTDAQALIERYDAQPDDPARSDTEFALLRAWLLVEQGRDAALVDRRDAVLARIDRSADLTGQSMLSETCWLMASAALRLRRPDVARQLLHHLAAAPASNQDPGRAIVLDLLRAELAHGSAEAAVAETADALYARALDAAEASRNEDLLINVAVAWQRNLLAEGDLERAAAVGGRLSVYAERDYRAAGATAALYRALGHRSLADAAMAKAKAMAGERDPDRAFL